MKRWTTLGGLAAILVAVLLAVFAFTGPEPLSTQDIDAIFDQYMNEKLHPATFVPGVPREEVVRKALESAGRTLGGKDASTLETRTTVGLYAWKDEEGNWVEGRKAWLVVVDDLPITFPSGPAGRPQRQRRQNQLVAFFDADTGQEIWGLSQDAGLRQRTHRPAIGNPAVTLTESERLER